MAKSSKPNILIIWGDDIGIWNISHFQSRHDGLSRPPTSTVSRAKARPSPIFMASKAARPAAPPSLPVRTRSEPALPRSACPAPRSDCMPKTRPSPKC